MKDMANWIKSTGEGSAIVPGANRFCSNCGSSLQSEASYCANCAAKFSDPTPSASSPTVSDTNQQPLNWREQKRQWRAQRRAARHERHGPEIGPLIIATILILIGLGTFFPELPWQIFWSSILLLFGFWIIYVWLRENRMHDQSKALISA